MPIGPVELLVVSFGKPDFSGEILEELSRLRESGVIRLIDALAVQNNLDGSRAALGTPIRLNLSTAGSSAPRALRAAGAAGRPGRRCSSLASF